MVRKRFVHFFTGCWWLIFAFNQSLYCWFNGSQCSKSVILWNTDWLRTGFRQFMDHVTHQYRKALSWNPDCHILSSTRVLVTAPSAKIRDVMGCLVWDSGSHGMHSRVQMEVDKKYYSIHLSILYHPIPMYTHLQHNGIGFWHGELFHTSANHGIHQASSQHWNPLAQIIGDFIRFHHL